MTTQFYTLSDVQEIHIKNDKNTGLIAIVALDKPDRFPGLGGCRCLMYDSIDDAILDAVRLAKTMSLKTAIANIPFSGGKAVLIRPKQDSDRSAYFKSFGKFIEELNGKFITGCDSGVVEEDMKIAATQTQYITGFKPENEQRDELSYLTALGIRRAMEASVKTILGKDSLKGLHISVQGVGKIGYNLAKEIFEQGGKLSICDINFKHAKQCAEKFTAELIDPAEIYDVPCDIFAPCGLGNIINDITLPKLTTHIICGGANNQLANDSFDKKLFDKGICYVPDFIANVGGTIYAAGYYQKNNLVDMRKKVDTQIYEIVHTLCIDSLAKKLPTLHLSNNIIENLVK